MTEHRTVHQAGQTRFEGLTLSVIATYADERGPLTELSIAADGHPPTEASLRPGDSTLSPGGERISLVDMEPSTRERRGWVRLAITPSSERALAPTQPAATAQHQAPTQHEANA